MSEFFNPIAAEASATARVHQPICISYTNLVWTQNQHKKESNTSCAEANKTIDSLPDSDRGQIAALESGSQQVRKNVSKDVYFSDWYTTLAKCDIHGAAKQTYLNSC